MAVDSAAGALDQRARQFIDTSHWGAARCELLSGDASGRRYFRLRTDVETIVLMDASQNLESVGPFILLNQHLGQLGFSVPAILARNPPEGLLLLEDFGDQTFARLLDNGAEQGCTKLHQTQPGRRGGDVSSPVQLACERGDENVPAPLQWAA